MTQEKKSLLKKKIASLTAEDVAALEKPLGTTSRPFPMWGTQRIEHDGKADLQQVLSVIKSDDYPMMVYSDRPYKEVVAMAYCDMPVPSMLPLFFDGLERRKPESTNRAQMMIGDPGHGKSFLGALQGRLRAKGPVEVFDCGGKNMNDLLFEMVLDFGAGDALPKAIDKRLAAGVLQPLSQALLKQLPAETVSLGEGGQVESIDWNALKSAGNDKVQAAFDTLTKVSKVEGLDNAGGNALGMNSQYGALVRAFLENREIVLDEYNKSREGSDNALQTVWQFVIGEIRECTVENPLKNKDNTSGPSSFTFKREDMGLGFFVTLTGNKKEDGTTTRSLNKSVYSRLSPQTLPDPDVIDWQHRICQMIVGLPVSTLYTAFKEEADADPNGFGDWLMWLRKTKAEVDGAPVPELQETLLANWKSVVHASEKLAQFYDKWAGMTNAENVVSAGHADLVEEVDEEYSKKEGIDFRKIKQHLEEAVPIRPRMQAEDAPRTLELSAWEKPPAPGEKVPENPSLRFGTRLVEFLERTVYEKTAAVGKKKLYEKLRKAMEEGGFRDISLKEGARSKQSSVEDSLNVSAFTDRDLSKQARLAHKIFCDYLRSADPSIEATDDQIVTPKKFLDALKHVKEAKTAEANELFIPNRDPETLYAGTPLLPAQVVDTAVFVARGQTEMDIGLDDLVSHDDFLAALALPTVGAKNLSSVWESNIRPLAGAVESPAAMGADASSSRDEDLKIAENKSDSGIATTSLKVLHGKEGKEETVSIHIVRNANTGKALVVSEALPSKLKAAFREAGVIHVDRHDPQAEAKAEAGLAEVLRGHANVKASLSAAFAARNTIDAAALMQDAPPLAAWLVDAKLDMNYPKYVVRSRRAGA